MMIAFRIWLQQPMIEALDAVVIRLQELENQLKEVRTEQQKLIEPLQGLEERTQKVVLKALADRWVEIDRRDDE